MNACYRPLQAVAFIAAIGLSAAVSANVDQKQELLEKLQQLDRLDRLEYLDHEERARKCIANRSYGCAEDAIKKAARVARSPESSRDIKVLRADLQKERDAERSEQEAERRRIEAEERQREAEERAEERRQQRERDLDNQRRLMAQIGASTISGVTQEQRNRIADSMYNDLTYGTKTTESTARSIASQNNEIERRNREAREQSLRQQQQRIEAQRAEANARQQQQRDQAEHVRARQQAAVAQATQRQQEAQTARDAELERQRQAALKAEQEAAAKKAEQERIAAQAKAEAERKAKAEEDKRQRELAAAERKRQQEEEKAARIKATNDYIQNEATGSRLKAIQCFGEKHVIGVRPRVKPELAACMYLTYRFRCPGEQRWTEQETTTNYIGMMGGCYGESYELKPKPSCPVEQIELQPVKGRGC